MERSIFLQTKRIEFSTWHMEDFELAKLLWANPNVRKYICASGIFSEKEIIQRLLLEIENQKRYRIQYWPIFQKDTEDFIGVCGLRPLEDGYELGVHLRPEYWKQAYATEAAQAVINYAFTSLKAKVIYVGHHPDNKASSHLVKKLGFVSIGLKYYPPTSLMHRAYKMERK